MSLKDAYCSAWEVLSVEIASGHTITDSINLGGLRLFSLILPVEWSSSVITFQSSYDEGITWHDIWKNGTEYTIAASQDKDCGVDVQRFSSVQFLRIRSGTASAPVPQQETRSMNLVLRGI